MSALRTGELAPDFTLQDQTGTARSLGDLLAGGPLVIFFYPAAMTPVCTKESCHFRDLASEFTAAGGSIVGISQDAVSKQAQFDTKHGFGYPLLSDEGGTVAAAFGVKRGFLPMLPTKRVTFVVGTDRRILEVVSSELQAAVHADKALAAVKAARTAA